jgi:serine/threonine protein kinase
MASDRDNASLAPSFADTMATNASMGTTNVVHWRPKCPKCGRQYPLGKPPRDWVCLQCSSRVWQPDEDVVNCMACRTTKLGKGSRHHCRLCGNLVCTACSTFTMAIAGWGPEKFRVCKPCAVPHVPIHHEGFLQKLGSKAVFGGEKLQRRYFELRGTCLIYGQNREGSRYGCLNISGCRVMDDPSHDHALCLVGEQLARAYILAADSDADKAAWRAAIEEMLRAEADGATGIAGGRRDSGAISHRDGDSDSDGGELEGPIEASPHGALSNGAPSATESALLSNAAAARTRYESQRARLVGLKDFELIKVIGTGAFSHVMLARRRGTATLVALKAYDKAAVTTARQGHTLNEERQTHGAIAQAANDPGSAFVAKMQYAFQTKTHLFLATEWCPGGELYFHLQVARRLSEARARLCIAEVALALDLLHRRGILYRDVKPENVVVRADGHCALLDLAMSSTVGESAGAADPHTVRLTEQHRSKTFCGTPEYMAPEVAERNGHSVASDWWSLGVLLYELVAGVPPFFSRNTAEIYDMIRRHPIDCPAFFSGELKSLIARLLDRDANMRLKSVKDLFAHPFFRGLGRDRVARRESTPEFVPQLANEADTKYFSPAFTQLAVRTYLETPVTDDDAAAFRDYSYPPPAAAADDDGGAADDREAAASAAAARRVAM